MSIKLWFSGKSLALYKAKLVSAKGMENVELLLAKLVLSAQLKLTLILESTVHCTAQGCIQGGLGGLKPFPPIFKMVETYKISGKRALSKSLISFKKFQVLDKF